MIWLLDYLASLGIDAAALASRNGIAMAELHQADARISEASHTSVLCEAQPGRYGLAGLANHH